MSTPVVVLRRPAPASATPGFYPPTWSVTATAEPVLALVPNVLATRAALVRVNREQRLAGAPRFTAV